LIKEASPTVHLKSPDGNGCIGKDLTQSFRISFHIFSNRQKTTFPGPLFTHANQERWYEGALEREFPYAIRARFYQLETKKEGNLGKVSSTLSARMFG